MLAFLLLNELSEVKVVLPVRRQRPLPDDPPRKVGLFLGSSNESAYALRRQLRRRNCALLGLDTEVANTEVRVRVTFHAGDGVQRARNV